MKLSVVTPLWQDRPAAENLHVAQLADKLGYPTLWVGEMATYDAFAFATAAGLNTTAIDLAIGPLAVSVRSSMTLAMGVASVADLTRRRVHLALGASSTVVVEEWHGRKRTATARHLGETAQIVRGLMAGEKVNFKGEQASSHGYRLRLEPVQGEVVIAAFGPRAVKAAAQHADCMLLNMVTPQSLRALRAQLVEHADRAGRKVPRVAVWLPCAVTPSEASSAQILRGMVGYLAAPGYGEMFAAAGFEESVAFARSRPHPKALLESLPNEIASACGLVGSVEEIRNRLQAYQEAGADEICLVPATATDPAGAETLAAMSQFAAK